MYQDNRPQVDRLTRMLAGLGAKELAKVDPLALAELLEVSSADVELKAATAFNGRSRLEQRDGGGTAYLMLWRAPATRILDVRVETPILGYTRVYLPDEIKLYRQQGQIQVFTYKMVAETVTGMRMDHLHWGIIFPPLPQCVKVTYCYGFPQFDPDADAGAGRTTYDGGTTFDVGDTRLPEETLRLTQLRQAALAAAAASYLAQNHALGAGIVTSVSFDGFSKSMNPQAFGAQVEKLVEQRDKLLERRKRPMLAAVGG